MSRHVVASLLLLLAGSEWCFAQPSAWRSAPPVSLAGPVADAVAPPAPADAGWNPALRSPEPDHPAGPFASSAPPAFPPPPVVLGPSDPGSSAARPGGCPASFDSPRDPCDCYRHCWLAADYLFWRVKDAPLPVPLVTRGLNNVEFSGAVGEPGTQILYGNQSVDFGNLSGARIAGGWWFDAHDIVGVEAGGFFLQQQTNRANFSSGPGGDPLLGIPFFNTETGREDLAVISVPGQLAGRVDIASSIRYWGVDSNLDFNLYRDCHACLDVLAGFRYLQLEEELEIDGSSTPLDGSAVSFRGQTFPASAVTTLSDRYQTRNQFAGGQLGVRTEWDYGSAFVQLTGKVALGNTHETVDAAGGLFAQPGNSGQFSRNAFTAVPEADITVGYQLTRRIRAFAGYQFTYWSSVVRPGDQINRNVNPTQVPTFTDFGLPSTQPAASPVFGTTNFWAYGANFGLELSY